MEKAIVALNKLDRVLLTLLLCKAAGFFIGKVSHQLDAVERAIIHFYLRAFINLFKIQANKLLII